MSPVSRVMFRFRFKLLDMCSRHQLLELLKLISFPATAERQADVDHICLIPMFACKESLLQAELDGKITHQATLYVLSYCLTHCACYNLNTIGSAAKTQLAQKHVHQ